MNKFIDLIGQITERLDVPYGNIRLGIHEALAYLDRYPSQVPGRTITEGDLIADARADAWADAWDEGQEAGWNEAEECWAAEGMVGDFHKHSNVPNPYRER